jgi:nanoRNase/pAp phosphatase (c-di-AMP/oligoRNAs hydrolase)
MRQAYQVKPKVMPGVFTRIRTRTRQLAGVANGVAKKLPGGIRPGAAAYGSGN